MSKKHQTPKEKVQRIDVQEKSKMLTVFSKNLQHALEKKGIDPFEFAAKLRVSTHRVYPWINAKCFPSINYLVAICDLLEIKDIRRFLTERIQKK